VGARVIDAIKAAEAVCRKHLNVQPGEEVVIVVDQDTDLEMAYALAGVVQSVGAEYTIAMMPTRADREANVLTRFIDKGLEAADVLIGLTKSSGAPCYSAVAQKRYYDKKMRSISMVLRSLNHFTRGGATADYDQMAEVAEKLAAIWRAGREIRVTSAKGTDLRAPIVPDRVRIESGFATKAGEECAFSDGEVYMYPTAGADGIVIVDGPLYKLGLPSEPVRLEVAGGRVVRILGKGRSCAQLQRIVASVPNADNFAEIAVGINPASLRNGDFEEEKKALGNVHVAVGKMPTVYSAIHMDLVVYDCTVAIDGKVIVQDGELKL